MLSMTASSDNQSITEGNVGMTVVETENGDYNMSCLLSYRALQDSAFWINLVT